MAVIYKVTARESVNWVENYTLIANQSTESKNYATARESVD